MDQLALSSILSVSGRSRRRTSCPIAQIRRPSMAHRSSLRTRARPDHPRHLTKETTSISERSEQLSPDFRKRILKKGICDTDKFFWVYTRTQDSSGVPSARLKPRRTARLGDPSFFFFTSRIVGGEKVRHPMRPGHTRHPSGRCLPLPDFRRQASYALLEVTRRSLQ